MDGIFMGEILALLSAFCFGLSNIYIKKAITNSNNIIGLLYTGIVNLLISSIALTASFFITQSFTYYGHVGIVFFIFAGFFSSFMGRLFLFKGIERIGAARVSGLKLSAPVFSIFIGLFILKEKVIFISFIGLFIVIGGLVLLAWEVIAKEDTKGPANKEPMENEIRKTSVFGVVFGLLAGTSFGTANIFRKIGIQSIPNAYLGLWLTNLASVIFIIIYLMDLVNYIKPVNLKI